ncbi:hypothetical protein H6P81_002352 [Aristolochia fimbriata]|uniref:Clathrin heavy chain n=1 Tax=Aristolochia fimbriata TaxID=158543 RepID=A0AAV7FA32_ARIFI|nr:hypothetical protein H6P81_002352 [Aristolochia fimbriata]
MQICTMKSEEPKVDSELIYAYAKIDSLRDIKEFILMPNVANLPNVGDRLYDKALYEAAKVIYAFISDWAKLAVTLVKLKQFQGAVDAAQKANSSKTWKEVCFACVDVEEFRLAQIFGLNIMVQTKYTEAAELAADFTQGILRTPDTVAKFQVEYTPDCLFLLQTILQTDSQAVFWKLITPKMLGLVTGFSLSLVNRGFSSFIVLILASL